MSTERSPLRIIRNKVRERIEKKAKLVIDLAHSLLEGTELDASLGREIIVEVPHTDRGYRINDLSETTETIEKIIAGDRNALKRALTIQPLKKYNGKLGEAFDAPGVAFPIPFYPGILVGEDAYSVPWSSRDKYSSSNIKRLAKDLQVAVPYRD